VKAVRADPKMDILKILMVTTEAEHDGIKAALDAGADEYLMKPFDEDVLVDRLGIMGIVL
jgi:two-component system chemotaxis response regulator CheY